MLATVLSAFLRRGANVLAFAVLGILLNIMGDVSAASAQSQPSLPLPWQVGLTPSASPVMSDIISFDNFLVVIMTAVVILVFLLLVYVAVRFNAKANPVPSKTAHNTTIEVIWTVVPILILVAIAVPSFRLLYLQGRIPQADVTVKVTGKQWFWSYEYPDHGNLSFDSLMVAEKDLKPSQPRLLAVDNEVVVPVGKVVRVLVTASDVIHSFAVPSFGIKADGVPGRLNETWFKADKVGVYYGQCSELCGKDHAFMPIAVRVVSEQDFAAWLTDAKKKFSGLNATQRVATAN